MNIVFKTRDSNDFYLLSSNPKLSCEVKENAVHFQAMKTYMKSIGKAPLILKFGTSWWRMVIITPRPLYTLKSIPVRTKYESTLAAERGWKFWRKIFYPCWNSNTGSSSHVA
jgi:hypothetical protein